jgi:peptide chain release factor 2
MMATKTSSSSLSSAISYSEEALGEAKRQFQKAVELYEINVQGIPDNLDQIIADLETESSDPTFWDAEKKDRNSVVTKQLSFYSKLQSQVREWELWRGDGQVALEMLQFQDKESLTKDEKEVMLQELQSAAMQLLADNQRYQLQLLLCGPYDDQPCRLVLTAGAGGTEANDWVADLRRMYERHAERMGFLCQIEDSQPGDVVGYKSVEMVISSGGPTTAHPYGWFKHEKGAHRLVRLSPFNSNNKRQTTFAGVDVAPIFTDETSLSQIEIPDKDLEITTMRSGGAGGQNVNKVSSAVRIKHLPSGLQVKCTQERSQAQNKDLALKRLKAQLLAIAKEQRVAEIQEIRGDQVEASWGAQIRNYVLHPYKLVKDQRTSWETSDTQGFLDGDLEDCIAALLRHQAAQEQEAAMTQEK